MLGWWINRLLLVELKRLEDMALEGVTGERRWWSEVRRLEWRLKSGRDRCRSDYAIEWLWQSGGQAYWKRSGNWEGRVLKGLSTQILKSLRSWEDSYWRVTGIVFKEKPRKDLGICGLLQSAWSNLMVWDSEWASYKRRIFLEVTTKKNFFRSDNKE